MRKLVERILLFVMGALCITGVLFLSCDIEDPIDTTNKWFKVATDDPTTGDLVILDMSRGYAYSRDDYIIIVIKDSEGYDTVIAFPNGGYWTAPIMNPDLNKSTAWEKKY
jgi:hypothetical protein